MSHKVIAGSEVENIDPSRTLCNKTVTEQKMTFGEVSEWLYRGNSNKIKVKNNQTKSDERKYQTPFNFMQLTIHLKILKTKK